MGEKKLYVIKEEINLSQSELLQKLIAWTTLTQLAFAERIGVNRITVKNWLDNKHAIPQSKIARICQSCNIPMAYFENKYTLPESGMIVNEPETPYTRTDMAAVQEECNRLRNRLIDTQEELLKMKDKVISLQDDLIMARTAAIHNR